ncbi:conserved hypothetical protein [Pyrenophora tritici-repentis Pt-1C-BFP]|uniref:Glycosyltransferase family 31 protein n=1 Tax=Pyrenophora tritici-repentis (strain Pt-1C-BFP) TaxID=426418 RepID=B2W5D0_PYRTR|nr:uncharacterized protein PTRG_04830 [Pyrenophora tritici-repentis Pt-1C-BFP]EDU47737.1 conserved hypothetical protein [Pyrenophora tritici-repentis Pt-1C-BFP]
MPHRSVLCRLLFCAIFSVSVLNIFTRASSPFFHQDGRTYAQKHTEELFCPHSDLADDILIVLRTGATESLEKVPVHFRTTLRCVPHFVVHSDLEEEIEGHAVHDVLKDVTEETKKKQDDFKLYHQLQEHGRRGVHQKVETSMSGSSQGDYLRTDNAGWQLDKWKFLPMVDQALKEKPDAKCQFDDSKPYYIGKHLFIKDVEFAYGGAGFALSNPAIRKVSQQRSTKVSEYEEFTATHWVGDCALGKVLEDAKVPLYRAFPHFQSDSPATLNPAITKIDRGLWCYPAITYHHVSPAEIEELWAFEQDWYQRHPILLRHRDIFTELVRPKIGASVLEWNNMSADKEYNAHDHSAVDNELERNAWKSFDHCHALCEEQTDCIQFSFNEGSCGISTTFKLGYAKPHTRFRSGWMLDRVDDLFKTLEAQCGMRDWWAPQEETQRELKMRRKRSLPAPKI